MKSRHYFGVTLIELMIVIAVVAILASVAFPTYQESILKSRRAEGRAAVMATLLQQERYMTQNNTYLAFTATASNVPFKQYSGDNLANSAYVISSSACTTATASINSCVNVTATPIQADAAAGSLTADSNGGKTCTGTDTSKCWK
jgi:type IV pilus assembly protein PilE